MDVNTYFSVSWLTADSSSRVFPSCILLSPLNVRMVQIQMSASERLEWHRWVVGYDHTNQIWFTRAIDDSKFSCVICDFFSLSCVRKVVTWMDSFFFFSLVVDQQECMMEKQKQDRLIRRYTNYLLQIKIAEESILCSMKKDQMQTVFQMSSSEISVSHDHVYSSNNSIGVNQNDGPTLLKKPRIDSSSSRRVVRTRQDVRTDEDREEYRRRRRANNTSCRLSRLHRRSEENSAIGKCAEYEASNGTLSRQVSLLIQVIDQLKEHLRTLLPEHHRRHSHDIGDGRS